MRRLTNFRHRQVFAILGLTFAACASAPDAKPSSADGAIYEVTFQGVWTKDNQPTDYPDGAFSTVNPAAAHFSGVIGAAHSPGYSIYKQGALATPGLKSLSHTGSKSPLDEEIMTAAQAGHAGPAFETGVFFDVTAPKSATFEVSRALPLVSLVAMIAPSSDWFVGASDVDLKENGQWVPTKVVEAYAWDSGTYEGATYKVDEKESSPHMAVMPSKAPVFMSGSKTPPVAILTFTRKG